MVQWLSTMMNKSMTCYQIDKIYSKKKKRNIQSDLVATEGMHIDLDSIMYILCSTLCTPKVRQIVICIFR